MKLIPLVATALVLAVSAPARAFVPGYTLPPPKAVYYLVEQPGTHWIYLQGSVQSPDGKFALKLYQPGRRVNDTDQFVEVEAAWAGTPEQVQQLTRRWALGYLKGTTLSSGASGFNTVERKYLTGRKPRDRSGSHVLDTQKTDELNRGLLHRMGHP